MFILQMPPVTSPPAPITQPRPPVNQPNPQSPTIQTPPSGTDEFRPNPASQLSISENELNKILEDLNSRKFKTREAASKRLIEIFENSNLEMIQNLKTELNTRITKIGSLEVRTRIKRVLKEEDSYLVKAQIRLIEDQIKKQYIPGTQILTEQGVREVREQLERLAKSNRSLLRGKVLGFKPLNLEDPKVLQETLKTIELNRQAGNLFRKALGLPPQNGLELDSETREMCIKEIARDLKNIKKIENHFFNNPAIPGSPFDFTNILMQRILVLGSALGN